MIQQTAKSAKQQNYFLIVPKNPKEPLDLPDIQENEAHKNSWKKNLFNKSHSAKNPQGALRAYKVPSLTKNIEKPKSGLFLKDELN